MHCTLKGYTQMKRKESFINDKRRISYLASVYNRITRGKSVLIEGGYGAGKPAFAFDSTQETTKRMG
jgi:hypothetical protein